jgi:hypothetical protein
LQDRPDQVLWYMGDCEQIRCTWFPYARRGCALGRCLGAYRIGTIQGYVVERSLARQGSTTPALITVALSILMGVPDRLGPYYLTEVGRVGSCPYLCHWTNNCAARGLTTRRHAHREDTVLSPRKETVYASAKMPFRHAHQPGEKEISVRDRSATTAKRGRFESSSKGDNLAEARLYRRSPLSFILARVLLSEVNRTLRAIPFATK